MAKLEDLTRGAAVKGILPDCLVTVIDIKWYGSAAVELTYKDPGGKPNVVLLYRDREPTLEIAETGRPWSFDGDGKLFRLVSEAHRIDLAHLFDPLLAIHTSMVEPLPHQITAVYGEMLPRQPLRFLLADDPGAGKTIMAGLLIKELLIRGDLHRCMIVCPGNLAEQWQDELYQRFQLPFEILTNDKLESARTGSMAKNVDSSNKMLTAATSPQANWFDLFTERVVASESARRGVPSRVRLAERPRHRKVKNRAYRQDASSPPTAEVGVLERVGTSSQSNIMGYRSNSRMDTAAKLWPSSKISPEVPPSRASCPIALLP